MCLFYGVKPLFEDCTDQYFIKGLMNPSITVGTFDLCCPCAITFFGLVFHLDSGSL